MEFLYKVQNCLTNLFSSFLSNDRVDYDELKNDIKMYKSVIKAIKKQNEEEGYIKGPTGNPGIDGYVPGSVGNPGIDGLSSEELGILFSQMIQLEDQLLTKRFGHSIYEFVNVF